MKRLWRSVAHSATCILTCILALWSPAFRACVLPFGGHYPPEAANGRLIQTGTPASILLAPADDFVRDFLGGEASHLRLLDLVPVRELMKPGKTGATGAISAKASLKTALNLMLASHRSSLGVENESGARLGEIHLGDIVAGAMRANRG